MNKKKTEAVKKEETSLVTAVSNIISDYISKDASETFLNHKWIKYCGNNDAHFQRVIINRFFTHKLIVYRAQHDTPVNTEIANLCNDGSVEEWVKLFSHGVMPFVKQHKVLD